MKKGTAGIILLNELMPPDVQFPTDKEINKSDYKKILGEFATKHPELYKDRIHKIVKLSEEMAYFMGSNVGIKDLHLSKLNEKKVEQHIKKVEQQLKKAKTKEEKQEVLVKAFNDAQKEIKSMKDLSPSQKNELLVQVNSGARGKPAQAVRALWSPFYAVDMEQNPKDFLIKNNFTKGLTPAEYFNVSSQGRFAAVQTANATSEPGELAKILVANGAQEVITEIDCGTKNGKLMDKNDHHIVGRFEAGTNKLIDEAYWKQLKNSPHIKKVRVRSPITCQAAKGICAKCYGLDANGKLPAIGTEVGIIAAQSIGEPTTQMVLSTKHSTGAKTIDNDKLLGVEGLRTITNSPDHYEAKSEIAPISGMVDKIEQLPQGGYNIVIVSGNMHKNVYVPTHKTILVKKGDFVFKGQQLNRGVASTKELMDTRGSLEAMEHESNELYKTFKDSTGMDMNKKHFEVLAKGHLNTGIDETGEVVDINGALRGYPSVKRKAFVSQDIIGKYLAEDVDLFLKGTKIDEYIVNKLKMQGIHNIEITDQKPPVKPIYKTLNMRPIFANNFFGKVNYRYLQKAITDEVKTSKGLKKDEVLSGRDKHTGHFL